MISDFINFSIKHKTGIIKLNRPEALNALNYEMASNFLNTLIKWKINEKIERVLLYGEGKSLCAGGDVKSLYMSSGKDDLKKNFFKKNTF